MTNKILQKFESFFFQICFTPFFQPYQNYIQYFPNEKPEVEVVS